jgi:hypothetical protein
MPGAAESVFSSGSARVFLIAAPDHEGQDFVIDALSGSQQAIVIWYTDLPS